MDDTDEAIPNLDIDTAETMVRTILYRLDGTVTPSNEEALARALGHKTADSGAFRSKLADLRKYGFIDGYRDKQLTNLGEDLVENKERAIRTVLEEIQLFEEAKLQFGTSILDEAEWEGFLRDRGIDQPNDPLFKQARDTFNSLVRQLPEENDEPFPGELFDKYYSDLGTESKRNLCRQSLKKLARRPIPSIEYYDKILGLFEEDDPPIGEKDLLYILRKMCNASTEEIRDQRLDDTVDLAMGFLDHSYDHKVRGAAIHILEVMDPREAEEAQLDDLWETTKAFARKGADESDDLLRNDAERLFRLLVSEWADDSLLYDMFEDTYDDYDEATDYAGFLGSWHETCQEELGLT